MRVKLYAFRVSHPVNAVKLMLQYKGLDYKVVPVVPGFHPLMLRAAGFKGSTVPAIKFDGRRVLGSSEISRALDELQPDPPLFPADPVARAKVEDTEQWGDEFFQNLPRLVFRWSLHHNLDTLEWLIRTDAPWLPFARFSAWLNRPVPAYWARKSGATDERVKAEAQKLPAALDHVDQLIATGVIGGAQPNAADFQIAATVRVCLAAPSVAPLVEGRPCAELARKLMPKYPGEPIPLAVPAEWYSQPPAQAGT